MAKFEELYYKSILNSQKNIQPLEKIPEISIIDIYDELLSNNKKEDSK